MVLFWQFLFGAFVTGLTAFGGGVAFIPMLEAFFTQTFPIIAPERFFEIVGYASALPGPLGAKIVGAVGYERFGVSGLVFGNLAFDGPGLILALSLYHFLMKHQDQPKLQAVTRLIQPFILIMVAKVGVGLASTAMTQMAPLHFLFLFGGSLYLIMRRKLPPIFAIGYALVYGVILL